MKQESKWIYRVTLTAVFAALVFVSSMISVPIPVAIGDVTRIHLGNIFCLLSGLVLGPVGGGLAAGARLCPLRHDKPGVYRFRALYLCL